MKLKINILIAGLFFLISCSDEPTTPSPVPPTNYFPFSTGSYWIYQTTQLDVNQNKISGTETIDSIVCENQLQIEGKSAYRFIRFVNGNLFDTSYYYYDNGILLKLFNNNTFLIPGLKNTWFKIADFNKNDNNEWHVYDVDFENFIYNFKDSAVITNFLHTVNAKMTEKIPYKFDTLNTTKMAFYMRHDSRISFYYSFNPANRLDTVQVNVVRLIYYRNWFADNIGLVKMQTDPYSVKTTTYPATNYSANEVFKGIVSELLRYKLKNEQTIFY